MEEKPHKIERRKEEKVKLWKRRDELIYEYESYLSTTKNKLDTEFLDLLRGDGAILNDSVSVEIKEHSMLEEYPDIIKRHADHKSDNRENTRFPRVNALLVLFSQMGPDAIISSFLIEKFEDWEGEGLGRESQSCFRNIGNKEEIAMRLQELLPTLRSHLLWRPNADTEFKTLNRCSIGERGTALLSIIPVAGMKNDTTPTGPRGGTTTVSPGGLIRKSFWMHPDEVEALREAAYKQRRSESEIVREAVRRMLGVED